MDTDMLFPLEIRGKVIDCKTADDRKLLQEAALVAEDFAECKNFGKMELLKMSAVCGRYELEMLQQVTADLAERCDEVQPEGPKP